MHPGNLLLRGDQVAAVVDFDPARCCPPGYELMRALIYCTQPAGLPETYGPRVAAFLCGYLTVRPLSESEIDTMVELYRPVQILDRYGLHVCEGADPSLPRFGHARFVLLYWLDRNGPAITDLANAERERSLISERSPDG